MAGKNQCKRGMEDEFYTSVIPPGRSHWTSKVKMDHPYGGPIGWISRRGTKGFEQKTFLEYKNMVVTVRNCNSNSLSIIKQAQAHSKKYIPFKQRFIKSHEGIIADKQTGLLWYWDRSRSTWKKAKKSISQLKIDGGSWKMPTFFQLRTLYSYYSPAALESKLFPLHDIWSSNLLKNRPSYVRIPGTAAWNMNPIDGFESYASNDHPLCWKVVLAVQKIKNNKK